MPLSSAPKWRPLGSRQFPPRTQIVMPRAAVRAAAVCPHQVAPLQRNQRRLPLTRRGVVALGRDVQLPWGYGLHGGTSQVRRQFHFQTTSRDGSPISYQTPAVNGRIVVRSPT